MSVKKILEEIKKSTSDNRINANSSDEIIVMKEMLNDPDYKVGVYNKSGKVGDYCPREDAVIITEKVLNGAGISGAEAKELADKHTFGKAEAKAMVGISKEFINTYPQTGRKIKIGGREDSDVGIYRKYNQASTTKYPKFVGVDDTGKRITENVETDVPAYSTLKTAGSCPSWVKNKK